MADAWNAAVRAAGASVAALATSDMHSRTRQESLGLISVLETNVRRLRELAEAPPQQTQFAYASSFVRMPVSAAASAAVGDAPLPLIPLSPLVHKLMAHAAEAARAAASDESADEDPLARARRRYEDMQLANNRLAATQRRLTAASALPATALAPAQLAAHIASISARLFAVVSVRNELLVAACGNAAARIGSHARACIDWQQYLRNAAAASILAADASSVFGPNPQPVAARSSRSTHASAPPTDDDAQAAAIDTFAATALVLVYVYRDLCAASAMIEALTSPSIARLATAWNLAQPISVSAVAALSESLAANLVDEQLELLVEIVAHHSSIAAPSKPRSPIAVPSLITIIAKISEIYASYSLDAGSGSSRAFSGTSVAPVLSEFGARALEDTLSLVEAAQSNKPYTPSLTSSKSSERETTAKNSSKEFNKRSDSKTNAHDPQSMLSQISQPPPTPPVTLDAIQAKDESIVHWILTRVYYPDNILENDDASGSGSPSGGNANGSGSDKHHVKPLCFQPDNAWLKISRAIQDEEKRQKQSILIAASIPASDFDRHSVSMDDDLDLSDIQSLVPQIASTARHSKQSESSFGQEPSAQTDLPPKIAFPNEEPTTDTSNQPSDQSASDLISRFNRLKPN